MRATLEETVRLLVAHLHLFTLLSLTVWFPVHVFLNYMEFFGGSPPDVGRAFRVGLMVQIALDPLAVSAMLMALGRIKQGLPLGYWPVLSDGARAWGRLFLLRLAIFTVLMLPAVVAKLLEGGARGAAAGVLLLAVTVATVVFLVRFAVVEAVVVLEGRTVLNCWARAAALTVGWRRQIVGTVAVIFGLIASVAVLATLAVQTVPALNHFVARTLFDCALSVSQSLVTIALFLIYWRAAQPVASR